MTWKERLIGIPLATLGALLLLVMAAAMGLTRTDWGRERVRSYALDKLNGAISGHVEIDAVLAGDLLRTVRMAGVRIYEPDGSEFARIDTIAVRYSWTRFLLGNVTIASVELVAPVVQLRTSPGGWNFEEVFRNPRPSEPDTTGDPRSRPRVVLQDVAIRSGDVTIRQPWRPDGTDPDSSRWHLEQTDEGWYRVYRVERLNALLPVAQVEAPDDIRRLFQASQLSCRATIVGESVEIEQIRTHVEVRGDTLHFQAWDVLLPDSRLPFGSGWVTLRGRPEYDVDLRGDPVTTDDVRWLVPWLPPGVTTLDFRFRNLRDRIELEANNADWRSPGAALSGRFAMTLRDRPDGLRFNEVDLDVQRFTTELIDSITGWQAPVSAVLAGQVALDGPLSELLVDADVTIQADSAPSPSHVVALGMVRVDRDGIGAGNLDLQLDTVQLDLVRAFVPALTVRGEVQGHAWLDGHLAEGLSVDFDVEQRDRDLVPTHLVGSGTITADTTRPLRLDMDVSGDPFSLTTLSEYFPAIPFRGEYTGAFSAVGALDDLDVSARLRGTNDSLRIAGRLQLTADPPRYSGDVQGWRMSLPEFREGLPASDLDFRVSFDAQGASLQELRAEGRAYVSASFVGGVGFDSSAADLRIANGRLLVDTAVVLGEFGELEASGSMSLLPDQSDSLHFELRADSLGALNPWLNPTVEALAAPALTEIAAASESGPVPRVEGSARVTGWLAGEPGRLAITGRAEGSRLSFREFVADSFSIEGLDVGKTDGRLHARGDLRAANVAIGKLAFDHLALTADYSDTTSTARFTFSKGEASISGRTSLVTADGARTFGIDSLTVRLASSMWVLSEPVEMEVAETGAKELGELDVVGSSGRLTAGGTIEATGPTSFHAEITGANLGEMAVLWSDSVAIAGVAQARVELSGRARDPILEAELEIEEGRIFGVDFTTLRGDVDYRGGRAEIDVAAWQNEARMFRLHGTLPLDLTLPGPSIALPERDLALTLEGDSIPLTLATIITDQIADPQGKAEGTVYIRGTPHQLDLQGPVAISNGSFRVLRTGILYTDIRGALRFEGNVMEVWGAELRGSGGGSGVVRGTVTFGTLTNPEFDLTLEAVTLPAYDQLDAFAVLSGTATLRGYYDAPIVNGDLQVISGILYTEEVGRQREIVNVFEEGFTLLGELDEADRPSVSPFLENLTMDLNLNVMQDTWLRSADMNVEITGDLTVEMRPEQEEWLFRGTLQAVRGDYRLFNKRFAVEGGTVAFPGTPGFDPSLRILALYTVQTEKQPIEIQLEVSGRLANPPYTLELDSDHTPAIAQSDLLSYLLFGRPSYELTRTGQQRNLIDDVTAGVPQAFLGYALSSLLVGEAGIAYVDVSRVTPAGAEGEYRAGVGPALTATQVEVGWYLAPTVFVRVAQHLVGAVRPTVVLDWRLDDNLTLRGITEPRFGREGVLYYGGPGQSLEQSIGVFLFYGWTY